MRERWLIAFYPRNEPEQVGAQESAGDVYTDDEDEIITKDREFG